MPLPVSFVTGLTPPLLEPVLMVRLVVKPVPVLCGVNCTPIVQLDPGASEGVELQGVPAVGATTVNKLAFVPLIDDAIVSELTVLTFFTVTFSVFEVPTATFPKARVVGAEASTAVPERFRICGLLGSLSIIAIVPVMTPAASEVFGEKVTLMTQLVFCASEVTAEPQVVPLTTAQSGLLGALSEIPVT